MGLYKWGSILTLSVFCYCGPLVDAAFGRVAYKPGGSTAEGAPNPAERIGISGKITDGEGNPLEDTEILIFANYKVDPGHRSALGSQVGLSKADAEGSFTILMGTRSESVVFATKPGYVMDYKVLKAPSDNIDLVLRSKGRKLGGTVVNAEEEPVANALVGIAASSREMSDHLRVPWRMGLDSGNLLQVTADADGRFVVEDLPPLPLIVWTADAGETETLTRYFVLSKKQASVDLGTGDQLNLEAIIDDPASLAGRTFEEQQNDDLLIMQHESLLNKIKERQRDQRQQPTN